MTDPDRTAAELSELRAKVGELEQWRAAQDARREERDLARPGRVKLENDFRLELSADLDKAADSRRRLFEKVETIQKSNARILGQLALVAAIAALLAGVAFPWVVDQLRPEPAPYERLEPASPPPG